MSPREEFVEAMKSMWAEVYGDQGVPWRRYKTILRRLTVAFAEASGHDKTELLVDCGLEDTP